MGRELHPVLLVLGPAKDHPQAQYLVAVRNALELDDVAAMFVVVLAKSNQQIQKISKGSNPNDGTLPFGPILFFDLSDILEATA
jgi:hypothetical protein